MECVRVFFLYSMLELLVNIRIRISISKYGFRVFYRQKVMAQNFTTQKAASDSARSIQVAFNAEIGRASCRERVYVLV